MKKSTLLLALLFCGAIATSAQKPVKGDLTTELQFSPFAMGTSSSTITYSGYYGYSVVESSSTPAASFTLPGLRLRYFLTDRIGLRLTFGYDRNGSNISEQLKDQSTSNYFKVIDGNHTYNSHLTQFSISPGFEYHLIGGKRLSVYIGGELVFTRTNTGSSEHLEYSYSYNGSGTYWCTTDIHGYGVIVTPTSATTETPSYSYADRNNSGFGFKLLTGFDFYVYEGLYVGSELGFAYTSTKLRDATMTISHDNSRSGSQSAYNLHKQTDLKDDSKIKTSGFYCIPAIRLGWKF